MTCPCSGYTTPGGSTGECRCGKNKALYSFQSALLFFIVAHPQTYKFVKSILGNWVASDSGLATTAGVLVHAIVYGLIVYLLMKARI